MTPFDPALFFAAFAQAGMLKIAAVALPGEPRPTHVNVCLSSPDNIGGNGQISREYSIEYQHQDMPNLVEGVELVIDGELYRVRERPTIPEAISHGYWRTVRLTKVAT